MTGDLELLRYHHHPHRAKAKAKRAAHHKASHHGKTGKTTSPAKKATTKASGHSHAKHVPTTANPLKKTGR